MLDRRMCIDDPAALELLIHGYETADATGLMGLAPLACPKSGRNSLTRGPLFAPIPDSSLASLALFPLI